MPFLDTLIQRNRQFAESGFSATLKKLPSMKTVIIGCVDPRLDPADVFALEPGEAVVIRNIGGRLDPATLVTLTILDTVAKAAGKPMGDGWHFIVLHHDDCGIVGCLHHAPELLARHLGVGVGDLDRMAIDDPRASVAMDVASLKANPTLPRGVMVSGLFYDVGTGQVETIVSPAPIE